MSAHEVRCFAESLGCATDDIEVCDFVHAPPDASHWKAADAVLFGGSGDYSVVEGGPWLPHVLESMRRLVDEGKPTFASCWGFQAMALALGGTVVTDLSRAELGTTDLWLTEAGLADPIFAPLGERFLGQSGHQDIVDSLPPGAVGLVSSDRVANQAFRIEGAPIYGTQFHPELTRETILDRLRTYPTYVENIARMPFAEFEATCQDSPGTQDILRRFVEEAFGK